MLISCGVADKPAAGTGAETNTETTDTGTDGGNYNGVYHWYWQEKVDGQFRPVEGFCIKVENNTITGIQWYRIPID